MRGIGMVAVVLPALVGCTSVRMLQREGCWVKQTEKWPGRVSEELGFCSKPAPVWAQDRVARLVQECMAQADFRWQNRALAAWTRGEPIPPQDSDDKIAQTCMNEASAALGQEAENSALKSRLAELSQDREALRNVSDGDREFLKQSSDKMVSALGEAAKKPAPAAVATATSTGTAKTVEVHGAPAQPAPVVVTPRTLVKPADGCLAARKPAVRRGTASKLPADEPACPKTAQPPSPVSLGPAGGD